MPSPPEQSQASLDPDLPGPGSRRLGAALAVPVVVASGLLVRAGPTGSVGSAAGDVLYAVLVYVLVVVLAPHLRLRTTAAVALVLCWVVELAQLTPGPARLAEAWGPVRYPLGTSFVWSDLLLYAVGVLIALTADRGGARARARARARWS